MKTKKNNKPQPQDNQEGCDKKADFWTGNNAFFDKSSGKDPHPHKQKKYVQV